MKRVAIDIDRELTVLEGMDYVGLKDKWQALYDVPAPKKIGAEFLRLAIAHGLQEKAYGGLKPAVRRQLMQLANAGATMPLKPKAPPLRPGTRLVREWNGESHQVEVMDGGFVWRGKTYASLTAIAFCITGARWSGPRFFGLRGKVPS